MQDIRKLVRLIRVFRGSLKVLFFALVILSILYSIIYAYILFQGGAILTRKLESLTGKKVTLSSFHITPFLNLTIKDLNIEGMGRIDTLDLSPTVWGFITRKVAFNKVRIFKPEFSFERKLKKATPEGLTAQGAPATAAITSGPAANIAESKTKAMPSPNFIFKRLKIVDGTVNFIDHPSAGNEIKITLKEINFSLNNFYLPPRPAVTTFELNGKIPWREGNEEGKISAEGWINAGKRDMAATVKINDIDGIYLYPYYAQWVDLDKARIEKAKLNFTSNLNGVQNNLTAECHLELTDIVREPRPPGEQEEKAEKIAEAVLDIFKVLNQGKIVLDFTIRTKMDRPEFGFGAIKMAVEDKLAEGTKGKFEPTGIFLLPVKLLEGTIRATTDVSKAVIDGTFAVGNEFKKAVQDSFKKEQKQEKK